MQSDYSLTISVFAWSMFRLDEAGGQVNSFFDPSFWQFEHWLLMTSLLNLNNHVNFFELLIHFIKFESASL